jgi:hypothetical protein
VGPIVPAQDFHGAVTIESPWPWSDRELVFGTPRIAAWRPNSKFGPAGGTAPFNSRQVPCNNGAVVQVLVVWKDKIQSEHARGARWGSLDVKQRCIRFRTSWRAPWQPGRTRTRTLSRSPAQWGHAWAGARSRAPAQSVQARIQIECQIGCQNICQRECENRCQIECQHVLQTKCEK